jgi:uncharacterized protein YaaW (UPF0174 family)
MSNNATAIQRLGHVLYWTGCGVAGLLVLACITGIIVAILNDRNVGATIGVAASVTLIPAIISWLIGRACKTFLRASKNAAEVGV